jgi:hypothetical protein
LKRTAEALDRLREIVSAEPWDEDELADWAGEFLAAHHDDFWERWNEDVRRRTHGQLSMLRPMVGPYRHDPALPPLPDPPDGQLHGIGFVYDEDRDDRVLAAIDQLKAHGGIVAVAEHEGRLAIYTRNRVGESSVEVCGDTWVIAELVPCGGRWVSAGG